MAHVVRIVASRGLILSPDCAPLKARVIRTDAYSQPTRFPPLYQARCDEEERVLGIAQREL